MQAVNGGLGDAAGRLYVERYFPDGAGPALLLKTCLFENSPDEHFLIDLHPDCPSAVIAAGFSGHGFKFASVVGEIVADLALDGVTRHDIEFLRLARFLLGGRDLEVEELTTPERLPEAVLEPSVDIAVLDGADQVAEAFRTANATRSRRPEVPVIGGMASGGTQPGENRLLLGPATHAEGAVALHVSGPVRLKIQRASGSPMMVSAAK